MPRYHVKITGKDYDAMADLVRVYGVNVARHTVEKIAKGYRIDAHATGTQLKKLEAAGYVVERHENADQEGKARQKEVRKPTKKGMAAESLAVSTSAHYLNVVDVETALAAAAAPPDSACTKLIQLRNKTWEKRVSNALKIGKGAGS